MKTLRVYVLSYPAVLLLAFLITWVAGRLSLGHWPRASLDDPKSIGGWFAVPYVFTWLLEIVGLPVFVIGVLGVLLRAYLDATRRRSLLVVSALAVTCMAITVVLLRWDPFGVVSWYAD